MKQLPKGRSQVESHIFSEIWDANTESDQIATQAYKRILNSFADKPDGRDLADGFICVVDFFTAIGYRAGYRDARQDYEMTIKARRTPVDRIEAERLVSKVLREDPEAGTKKVCEELDKRGLSGWFGAEKYFGPRGGRGKETKRGEEWGDGSSDQAIVQWIHRIRTRISNEERAKAWLSRSSEITSKPSSSHAKTRAAIARRKNERI